VYIHCFFENCKSTYLQFLGYMLPWLRLYINFDKKLVGLHFGRFFHNHIWQHCQ
jgi:hypothetical protein